MDGSIQLWDMDNGSSYEILPNNKKYVSSVAFSLDGWNIAERFGSAHGVKYPPNECIIKVWIYFCTPHESPFPISAAMSITTCVSFISICLVADGDYFTKFN